MLVQVNSGTDLFGLPLASDDKGFVFVIVLHIILSLIAVWGGLTAMLMDKNSRWHNTFGKLYYWAIVPAFATVVVLSILRWPHNNHLFIIGILTTLLVIAGQRSARHKKPGWARLHAICMGCSYILLLTGFYVDNGLHLPFWSMFPQWFFWIFPALIGVPILLCALRRHPLLRQ